MSEYLTTGQAAELLGVSKPTVVRAIQRGLLRPALVTPGQHRRFRREDLLALRSPASRSRAGTAPSSSGALRRPTVRRTPPRRGEAASAGRGATCGARVAPS